MSVLNDTLYSDNLTVTLTDSIVFGDARNDTLMGYDSDDILDGWSGNDRFSNLWSLGCLR